LEYLNSRGLVHPELIDRFKLGFVNRTLGYRLPEKNRKAGAELRGKLQEIGILRDSGHEHFNGSLVVPLMDEHGIIIEVYGRKILGNRLRKRTAQQVVFLGHRIVRKRSRHGDMRVVTMIPWDKARNFRESLTALLSGNHSDASVDVVLKLNSRLSGWSTFYQYVDNRAAVFSRIDQAVFWKFAHWMARKYRCRIKPLLIRWYKSPEPNASKTWVLYDTVHGQHRGAELQRLVGRPKGLFKWRGPSVNPYLRTDERKTLSSRYKDVAIAMSSA
jgi:hypothetical protein